MSVSSRVAVVSGANKGIGLAIVKRLAMNDPSLTVILTARSEMRGREALASLNLPNVRFHSLDVTKESSVEKLSTWLEREYGRVDILINNAGYRFKGQGFNVDIVSKTVGVNFWGVVNIWNGLKHLVRGCRGRVVNVSSRSGDIKAIGKEELKRSFTGKGAKAEDITRLMKKFKQDVEQGVWKEEGWPSEAYSVSKIGVTALTRALARIEGNNGVAFYSCGPGLVKTDMSYSWAPLSTDEGAETPVYLATASCDKEELVSGEFYAERVLQKFDEGFELPEYVWKAFAKHKQDD